MRSVMSVFAGDGQIFHLLLLAHDDLVASFDDGLIVIFLSYFYFKFLDNLCDLILDSIFHSHLYITLK